MIPKVSGWDGLHLAENHAVDLLESFGYLEAISSGVNRTGFVGGLFP